MIDAEGRFRAVRLLEEYSAGAIPYDEVDNAWPDQSADRSLFGIGEVLRDLFFVDFPTGRRLEQNDGNRRAQELLRRCILFLRGGYVGEWTIDEARRVFDDGLGDDASVWPFSSQTDLEKAVADRG